MRPEIRYCTFLVKSADQFISARESTGGETILAGFPFFEDWGRDTMIALPGICIFTGQYETARQILRTFAVNERDGLMPNLFPEGGREPMYNTADAALLFINCVYRTMKLPRMPYLSGKCILSWNGLWSATKTARVLASIWMKTV